MMYESKGPVLTPKNHSYHFFLGFLNSCVFQYFISIVAPTLDYSEGAVLRTPDLPVTHDEHTEKLSMDCVTMSELDWDSYETSWDFKRHPLV